MKSRQLSGSANRTDNDVLYIYLRQYKWGPAYGLCLDSEATQIAQKPCIVLIYVTWDTQSQLGLVVQ